MRRGQRLRPLRRDTQCIQGACVTVPGFDAAINPNAPCTSTQDCLTLHGSNWVCQNNACQALGSDECSIVLGNYTADDVLLFGAILPIYGPHKSTGLPMERALAFAADQDFSGGVPFGLAGVARPVAVVLCDESQDPVAAAQAPRGRRQRSGDPRARLRRLVPRRGGAGRHPGTRAPLLSVRDGGPVVALRGRGWPATGSSWRTAPSSAGEAAAMAGVVSLGPRAADRRRARSLAQMKVSVVWRSDADGTSLHDALLSSLVFNTFPATAAVQRPRSSPTSPTETRTPPGELADEAVTTVTTPPVAQLVIILGRTEAVTGIIQAIESVSTSPPYYLVSHGLQVEELLALVPLFPTNLCPRASSRRRRGMPRRPTAR